MIDMARKKDVHKQVSWHLASVDDFDLEEEKYNLIISFESFHLFADPVKLITRCAKALQPGGSLCIGWRMFEWDVPLKDVIQETFDEYGIDRGTWGRWTCPTFAQEIGASKTGLQAPQKKELFIKTQAPLHVIANHVLHNSRSARISNEIKPTLQKALTNAFLQVFPSGKSKGPTEYTIVYTTK
jgi:ubiquinone/menaquinone biosynthesis C-methylase UbiE